MGINFSRMVLISHSRKQISYCGICIFKRDQRESQNKNKYRNAKITDTLLWNELYKYIFSCWYQWIMIFPHSRKFKFRHFYSVIKHISAVTFCLFDYSHPSGISDLSRFWLSCLVLLVKLLIIWVSNISILSVPEEYFRNALRALN